MLVADCVGAILGIAEWSAESALLLQTNSAAHTNAPMHSTRHFTDISIRTHPRTIHTFTHLTIAMPHETAKDFKGTITTLAHIIQLHSLEKEEE